MNEKLKAWMREKESRLSAEEKRKRDALLIDQGLFDKVYGDDPDEFFRYEIDEQGKERRYKEVPIQITDEEYAQIKLMVSETRVFTWNPVLALRVAALMVLVGCVIPALTQSSFWTLLAAPFPGALIYALAEIVDRLGEK